MKRKRRTLTIILFGLSLACVLSILRLGAASPGDNTGESAWLSPLAPSPNWVIKTHGECCEGNLAAAGNNTFVLLPVLITGNRILKSADGGNTWTQKYPPAPASVPFGIEGDMQAFGSDVIFFGTELGVAITAHSDDFGETFTPYQNPLASAGNDQAWSYLGPLTNMNPAGPLPTDEPYVLAGWMRIGSVAVFSFDGGITYPLQTPLVGEDGSGAEHIVCQQNAHAPTSPGDTRIPNPDFKNQKAGRYGAWGTDRKFYWAETSNSGPLGGGAELYVCKTDDFGVTWTGIKHPRAAGPGSGFVVTHTAFDNKGTLYVLHGNKLYVSFNQGESFAFIHTLPRYGNAVLSDSGSDQFFAVNCGTIHLALAAAGAGGMTEMWYLRGSRVDTATPVWDEELVETVGNNRLDFIQMVVNGNNIPTMSYTKPGGEVTTASRLVPMPPNGPDTCTISALGAVSRKTHGTAGTFDVNLPLTGTPGIECRSGGTNGDHQVVVNFASPIVSLTSANASAGSVASTSTSGNSVTVNLTNVPNAQTMAVNLVGVNDGTSTGDVAIPMSVLLGDTTASGGVNSSDIGEAKANSGLATTAGNFRTDVTVNGAINSSDIGTIKAQSGTGL